MAVTRGDLEIKVRERGVLEAARDTKVSSQLEGRATLIHLVPEGSVVREGDKVAELDASPIQEKRANQAIAVARAEAALRQARKSFEIMEKELLATEKTAESRLRIAEIRIEKFLGREAKSEDADGTNAEMLARLAELLDELAAEDQQAPAGSEHELVRNVRELLRSEHYLTREMGEMATQILQQIDEVSLARADLEVAKDTLLHSRRLAAKKFITQNSLEGDEINFKRQLSRLTIARNNLPLLINYTLPETLIGLEQELENAQLGLESVRATGEARRVREAAELAAAEAEYDLAREQLAKWDEQIRHAVMFAPAPGLVVYGRYDWDEPVYEGMEVRERQEIVLLPDVSKMLAAVEVHEAQVTRLAAGQTARVEVDALPGRVFAARVHRVATLPEPTRRSRDVKLFEVEVMVDADNSEGELRPGMTAAVEIDVGTVRDALQIPLLALERSGDTQYVWQETDDGPVATVVELGANNLTHVEIVAGLEAGDRIHLAPPPGARLPQPPSRAAEAPAEGAVDNGQR